MCFEIKCELLPNYRLMHFSTFEMYFGRWIFRRRTHWTQHTWWFGPSFTCTPEIQQKKKYYIADDMMMVCSSYRQADVLSLLSCSCLQSSNTYIYIYENWNARHHRSILIEANERQRRANATGGKNSRETNNMKNSIMNNREFGFI